MIATGHILHHRSPSIFYYAILDHRLLLLDKLWCQRYSAPDLFHSTTLCPHPGGALRPRIPRTCPVCWSAVPLSFTSHTAFIVCDSLRIRRHYVISKFCMQVSSLWICRQCRRWRRMIEDGMSLSARKTRTWTILNTLKYCEQQKLLSSINYPCDCSSIYSNIAMYQFVTCIIVKEVTYRINPGLECNVLLV